MMFNFSKEKFNHKLGLSFSDEVRDYGNANNNFKDVILKKYYLANYNFNYKISKNLDFQFNVDNILNEKYEQAYMYSSMPRSLNLRIINKF